MEISESVRAAHRDLSPAASQLLDYVAAHPEMESRLDFKTGAEVPEWVRQYKYDLQSWPVLLGAEKLREISRATVGITRLVRSIPARIFNNDVKRITSFYGQAGEGQVSEALMALLLAPPNGLDSALARCDFIGGDEGLKCVEVNGSANLGGWQLRFLERSCREHPALAAFFAESGLRPVYRDPWYAAFSHIVRETLRTKIADHGELNIVLVMDWGTSFEEVFNWDRPYYEDVRQGLNILYSKVLANTAPGLRGEVLCSVQYNDLIVQGGSLFVGEKKIHAVLEASSKPTPQQIYRCFKADGIGLYNGPLGAMLGDKRNLSLLSELEESDLLSAEERALVREHVPWTRVVSDSRTTWRGEAVSLLNFARAHRESLVLKPAGGLGGKEVYIGSETSPDEWSARLRKAAAGRGYLLQELVRSRPYLFQRGPAGCTVHDLVWGTFCFGDQYGGGFIRMMPRDQGVSVINSARGASEAFLFEV
jgi:hypothetical protein